MPAPVLASHAFTTSPSGTSIAITKPSGVASGDLIVVYVEANSTSTWAAPDGTWTNIASNPAGKVFHKTATGSEPASWTFTRDGTATVNRAVAVRITGWGSLGASEIISRGAKTSVAFASKAVTVADSLLFELIIDYGGNGSPYTSPGTVTEAADQTEGLVGHEVVQPSASGTRTFGMNASSNVGAFQMVVAQPVASPKYANITALYLPVSASAGSSLWGTDVRKLLDAPNGTADSTTITDHSTGGQVVRTDDPYSTSTADSDQTLFGWAIDPSNMGSVAGALRFYPAGNHTATIRFGHNGAASGAATLFMYVYRVAPGPGRARTLLGSNSAAFTLPALSAEVTATVTVALPEVIFAADETIQYSFEVQAPGIAITGRTVTMFTGTQSGVASRLDTPKLGVLADTAGSSAGSASAPGISGKVLALTGASSGVATAPGRMGATSGGVGASTGAATASGQGSSVASAVAASAGSATVTGNGGKVIGTTGTVEVGSGAPAQVIRPILMVVED